MSFKAKKDDILFLPLGGSGEIGMNLNLYHIDGKWLIADFGAGFAEDFLPGIDMIIPDISFLHEIKNDIVGIVLTHAHEDHLGGIPHLWEELKLPIYTTPFTAEFLRQKMADNGIKLAKRDINILVPGSEIKIDPFVIDLVQITHSVPEMNGLIIKTKYGNIIHTGDWKLDPDPVVGPTTDEKKLKQYGDEGVLAMICDSTNVFSAGSSGSEGELQKSLTKHIENCPQLVIVTTFASNVARIETVAKAARACGRKLVLAGRSLWRIVRAAQETGYLKECGDFLEESQIKDYDSKELVIMATGCQGEPRAAISKIINQSHQSIKVRPGDTVIFASKIIPGNEKRIFRMFNMFCKMKINVLTEKDHFVHVSGHPCQDELKRMYQLTRPKIAIPVHGEHVHMHEHAHLAKQWGAEQSIEVENGAIIRLAPGKAEKIHVVQSGIYGIDGNRFVAPNSNIMKTRRRMQNDGLVTAFLIIKNREIITEPVVSAPGLLDENNQEDKALLQQISDDIIDLADEIMARKKHFEVTTLEDKLHKSIKRFIKAETGKDPKINIYIKQL